MRYADLIDMSISDLLRWQTVFLDIAQSTGAANKANIKSGYKNGKAE